MIVDDAEVVNFLVGQFLSSEQVSIEKAESMAKRARDAALAYCYGQKWTKENRGAYC